MELWVLIGPDGRPWKGNRWDAGGQVKAFDNERAANASAAHWFGVTVKRFVIEEGS